MADQHRLQPHVRLVSYAVRTRHGSKSEGRTDLVSDASHIQLVNHLELWPEDSSGDQASTWKRCNKFVAENTSETEEHQRCGPQGNMH